LSKATPTANPQSWLKSVDNYWFGRGSPVTLGVFRILIGFLSFVNFLMLVPDFDAWYTERGYVPLDLAMKKMPGLSGSSEFFGLHLNLPFDVPRITLLGNVTDTRITMAVFGITLVASVLTMLGLWTRVSMIVLSLGILSIHNRNAFILHGGDSVLRIMVLYLTIAPSGLACSLDRVIGLWKGKRAKELPLISMWPQRLIAYNVALIYFTTFWHKMGGSMWREGIATWYPARLHEFDRFPVPAFFNEPPMIYLTTYGTLATELALGTLVFYRPLRRYVLVAGLLMHAYIEYSMNIPLFAFLICSGYIAFYEGDEVSAWAKRMGERLRKFRVRVLYPQGKALRPGPAAALEAADAFGLVEYQPGDVDTWQARRRNDEAIPYVFASWSRSLGAWTVGWIPGVWRRILDRALEPAAVAEPEAPAPKTPKAAAR